jgi:hypothetical protein
MKIQLYLMAKDGNESNLPRWLMTDISKFISSYSIRWSPNFLDSSQYFSRERTLPIVTIKISGSLVEDTGIWTFVFEIYICNHNMMDFGGRAAP